jgi:hypothetical protein
MPIEVGEAAGHASRACFDQPSRLQESRHDRLIALVKRVTKHLRIVLAVAGADLRIFLFKIECRDQFG